MVITRDVKFDESNVGFSPALLQETIEDTTLDFDTMDINDEPRQTDFRQAGKRKSSFTNEYQASPASPPVRRGAGLGEASAPSDFVQRRVKRRPSARV